MWWNISNFTDNNTQILEWRQIIIKLWELYFIVFLWASNQITQCIFIWTFLPQIVWNEFLVWALFIVVDLIQVYSILKFISLTNSDDRNIVVFSNATNHTGADWSDKSSVTEDISWRKDNLGDRFNEEADHGDESVLALDAVFGESFDAASSEEVGAWINDDDSEVLFSSVVSFFKKIFNSLWFTISINHNDFFFTVTQKL